MRDIYVYVVEDLPGTTEDKAYPVIEYNAVLQGFMIVDDEKALVWVDTNDCQFAGFASEYENIKGGC